MAGEDRPELTRTPSVNGALVTGYSAHMELTELFPCASQVFVDAIP